MVKIENAVVDEIGLIMKILMKKNLVVDVLILLVAACAFSGCTDSSPAPSQAPVKPAPQAAPVHPKYSPGDVVQNPGGDDGCAWLVIRYDKAGDQYERAFISRNNDGSWGYRTDSRTENVTRLVFEKVNTRKVTHVEVSAVPTHVPSVTASATAVLPIRQTTPPPAPKVSPAPKKGGVTPIPTGTANFRIKSVNPDTGDAGTTIKVTDISGVNFPPSCTIRLGRANCTNISATNVKVQSAYHASCSFVIPSNAADGMWEVVMTGSDGKYTRFPNGFKVRGGVDTPAKKKTPVTPTKNPGTPATPAALGAPVVNSVAPNAVTATGLPFTALTVRGSNIPPGVTVLLTRAGAGDLAAEFIDYRSVSEVECRFPIGPSHAGTWAIMLTSKEGASVTYPNAVTVSLPPGTPGSSCIHYNRCTGSAGTLCCTNHRFNDCSFDGPSYRCRNAS